jgi:hypothetical protein
MRTFDAHKSTSGPTENWVGQTDPSAETRRAIVLVLHDSSKPASTPVYDWTPKGLCKIVRSSNSPDHGLYQEDAPIFCNGKLAMREAVPLIVKLSSMRLRSDQIPAGRG